EQGQNFVAALHTKFWRGLIPFFPLMLQTQPVPNPISYFMHRSPWWFHRFETLVNHFIELVVPFFLLLGRRMSILHGLLQILFQVLLILSGNLSFLNWLTMVPSISCFDDASLGFLFGSRLRQRVARMQLPGEPGQQLSLGSCIRRVLNISLGLLIAALSVPVVLNLLSSRQVMNSSFNPLRIVNTYGAFGRYLWAFIGTSQSSPQGIPDTPGALNQKGNPDLESSRKKPAVPNVSISSSFPKTYEQNEWIIHLAGKLLAQEEETLALLATNPFAGREPPR
ncbi:LMF1 factor, partial [Certhia familiaris]|nr:LMF1 factor [Certhia familiaris]